MTLPERSLDHALERVSSSEAVQPNDVYPLAGIYSFGRGLIRREPISGTDTKYTHLTKLCAGQLVMSKLNAWEGALAVVPDEFVGSYVSSEYPIFNIDSSIASISYLKHLVSWPALWDKLTPRGSMVRRKRTKPEVLLQTCAPLPDLDEQRRIAAKLNSQLALLDTCAEKREKSYQDGKLLSSRSTVSVFRQATKHEESSRLGEIAEVIMGHSPQSDSYNTDGIGLGLLNGPTEFGEIHPTASKWTSAPTVVCSPGDLLYCVRGATLGRMNWADQEYCIGRGLAIIRPSSDGVDVKLLRYALSVFSQEIIANATGTTFPGTSKKKVENVNIPVARGEKSNRLVDKLADVERKTSHFDALQDKQKERLKALRSSLLNAAFSGKL